MLTSEHYENGTMESFSCRVGDLLGKATATLNRTKAYVGDHKTEEMVEDAREIVRRHPAESLIAAAAVGLAIGWAMRE